MNALLKDLDLSGKVGLKLLTPVYPSLVLMLTSDLDADEEKDRAALDALLNALLKELDLSRKIGL